MQLLQQLRVLLCQHVAQAAQYHQQLLTNGPAQQQTCVHVPQHTCTATSLVLE